MSKAKLTFSFSRLVRILSVVFVFSINIAEGGTIENLERERAILINTFLDSDIKTEERYKKLQYSKKRLIDLERMVLRDKSLHGRTTPHIKKAFQNYDLTFLVHGALENNVSVIDAWLSQIGVSTQSLMSTEIGPR